MNNTGQNIAGGIFIISIFIGLLCYGLWHLCAYNYEKGKEAGMLRILEQEKRVEANIFEMCKGDTGGADSIRFLCIEGFHGRQLWGYDPRINRWLRIK